MRLTQEIVDRATEKFNLVYTAAELAYGRTFIRPYLRFDLRGTRGGVACHSINTIRINPVLLAENVEQMIENTIPHEIAHFITHALFPYATSHGWQWRSVMARLGVKEITRCHSMDVSNAQVRHVKKITYYCACGEHSLSLIRHKRIVLGKKSYRCLKCHKSITREKAPPTPLTFQNNFVVSMLP